MSKVFLGAFFEKVSFLFLLIRCQKLKGKAYETKSFLRELSTP